jgi:hypothetical protein
MRLSSELHKESKILSSLKCLQSLENAMTDTDGVKTIGKWIRREGPSDLTK